MIRNLSKELNEDLFEEINACDSISGVARFIRTAPFFFKLSFLAKNSPKYFDYLINYAGIIVDNTYKHKSSYDVLLAIFILTIIDIDPILALFVSSMVVITDNESTWSQQIALSYILQRKLNAN